MVEVYVVSAFSKANAGGNKAGIVLDRPDLEKSQKIAIAKTLGYSETAFITQSKQADFCLEYFTPTEEVPLCGHATIATFSLLNKLGKLDKSEYTIATKSGVLKIQITPDGLVFMGQNPPKFYEHLQPKLFAGCFDTAYINEILPIEVVSTGLKDIMLPIKTNQDLMQLVPNFQAIADLSKKQAVVGLHAFTLDTQENSDDSVINCRNFAPLYDIDEESATGTSNCALACYLFKHVEQRDQYVFEQGHCLGSLSRIIVNLSSQDDTITSVSVGGEGYFIEKKSLLID